MITRTDQQAFAYLLLTVTTLVWGGNAIAGKLAVGHVSPFLLTFLRWVVACLILLPFAFPHLRRDWSLIKRNLAFLCLLGATGFALFNNMMYLALTYTTAINVAIEQGSMPLIVFLLNYLLFRTRVTWFQIIGFGMTFVGVIVTATRGSLLLGTAVSLNQGDALMLAAIMIYGAYSVFLSKKPEIHLLSLMCVLALSALATSLPFAIYEYMYGTITYPDGQGWAVILFAATGPSIISQLFWVMGLERIGSNRGGIFINMVPVFGALLAILILGEQFQIYHAAGLMLVLGGIWLAQLSRA